MNIVGLQKLTVLDFPGKVACTVFTPGCNFRCPFCHNPELVFDREKRRIPEADIFAFLEKRRGLLDGVCITGGEPTMQGGLRDFILRIRDLDYLVKLDTNGTHPELLEELLGEGLLDYVAMDVKSAPDHYSLAAGAYVDINAVQRSAELLMRCGIPYEFRTTMVRELHSAEDVIAMGKWLQGARRFVLQTFLDSGDLIGENLHPFSPQEMEEMAEAMSPYVGEVAVR